MMTSEDALYRIMQRIERNIGGGEGFEGIYGSIRPKGMTRVLKCMIDACDLGPSSCLVDVGSGLCRPLMHAAVFPGVQTTVGIEIDSVKCAKARVFCERVASEWACPVPTVVCANIENVSSLDVQRPATHVYSFWEGIPRSAKEALGRLVAASTSIRGVTVVQRACTRDVGVAMRDLNFPERMQLVDEFRVFMSGSGHSFCAYVFRA
jgi:hypothetical protein